MRARGFSECIMEDKQQQFECDECGAEYSVLTEMDLVVEFCCYCGEALDEIDWEYDDKNIEQAVEV